MHNLRITLLQADLYWEDPTANRAALEEKIWRLDHPGDVIVLPEMFTTGFTMRARPLAEPMQLHTFKWMRQMAAQTDALMLGSYIVQEQGSCYNRLVWMQPDGAFYTYDKRHLFRMAGEHEVYMPGNSRLVSEWKGWRICPMICYDLRFPVWSRNRYRQDLNRMEYDLLVFVANWPSARIEAWDVLLRARAIENLCYTAGVNRTGTDGNGIAHAGHSAVYSPRGECLSFAGEGEAVISTELSFEDLEQYRQKFSAWMDADSFSLE
jgi:omega-amidase